MRVWYVYEFVLSNPSLYTHVTTIQAPSRRSAVSSVARTHKGTAKGNTVRVESRGLGYDVFDK